MILQGRGCRMAVKNQTGDFRTLLTSIRKGEFAPVYLLMGEETYYIDRLTEALEQKVVPEDERDFNLTTVYGQDADIPALISSCQQYPFMSDRRLVMLKEAQSIHNAKNVLDGLADYVLRSCDTTVLVIVYKGGDLNGNSRLMKAATKSGAVVFKSPRLREWHLDGPIKEYCQGRHIGIQEKAMVMLKEYLGSSLTKIFSEIDKLIVAGGNDLTQITPELIERNIGISKDFNNYELCNALASRNYDRAMLIVKHFSSNPKQNPTVMTTATLFSFFSKLLMGHMSRDKSEQGLMAAMELKGSFALKDYLPALRNYGVMQVVKIIHLLREFDTKSKGIGSTQNEYELLTELVFNIFTVK